VPSRRTLAALVAVAPWVGWALIRGAGLDLRHPLVALMTFTPYAAATAWLPVLAALALRRRGVALAGLAAAVVLVAVVLPRALGDGRDAAGADGRELRVMSVNLFEGRADMAMVVRLAREQRIDVLTSRSSRPTRSSAWTPGAAGRSSRAERSRPATAPAAQGSSPAGA
jgi:hypothetical protein